MMHLASRRLLLRHLLAGRLDRLAPLLGGEVSLRHLGGLTHAFVRLPPLPLRLASLLADLSQAGPAAILGGAFTREFDRVRPALASSSVERRARGRAA